MRQAHGLQQLDAGDRRGAGAVHHHPDFLELAAGEVERVQERGGGDDGGAVLVVVEHGNIEQLAQALLDDEAFGRLDVLEIDAAESGMEKAHAVDELVDVARRDLEIDRVDAGETLEENGLPFHHRLGRERAEIAQAQHRRAVADDGDEIALGRVLVGAGGIALNMEARIGHARRVSERELLLRRQRLRRRDLDLARLTLAMEAQRFLLGHPGCGGSVVGHVSLPRFFIFWKFPKSAARTDPRAQGGA